MRDFVTWGAAIAFLLTALYAVTVRREVNTLGRDIGELHIRIQEQARQNQNLELEASHLRSPAALAERAASMGLERRGEAE